MGRPKEHNQRTAEALLDAAEALLAEGGPEAVSVRGTADAVGTTTRAVYALFTSKAGLLEALAARGYLLLAELAGGVPITDDPVEDLVSVGVDGFRRFALERPHLFRLTFERVHPGITSAPEVVPARQASLDALLPHIERLQGSMDRPSPLATAELAFAFHALCQGLASNELLRLPPPVGAKFWRRLVTGDPEVVWRTALRALVRGLIDQAVPAPADG